VPEDVVEIGLGAFQVRVAMAFGPRVLGLSRDGGPEIFASLGPEVVIDRPDSGVYRFRGGHRLWAAPEIPEVTYAPDDEPCSVTTSTDRVAVVGRADRAGLVKGIDVSLAEGSLLVDHILANSGSEPMEVAPWAITQLRLGGTAIIPIDGKADPNLLQANRSLVLWPYSDLADSRVTFHHGALTVNATEGPAFKIGTGPDPGRLGYLLGGHLFTKTVEPAGSQPHPDRGAVGQFYLSDAFCELETLGPLVDLEPGGQASHREVWDIEECDSIESAVTRLLGET
jgi:hypothetical protein